MSYTATWFNGDCALAREEAGSAPAAREIARSRLGVHRIRSGATHVVVSARDGTVVFDSRLEPCPAHARRPALAGALVKRWTMANATPS